MPRTAGGVDDCELEDLGRRVGGTVRFRSVEHWVEGSVQKQLHQGIGGLIAAASLTGVAAGFAAFGEIKDAGIGTGAGGEFQQAFVN